MWKYEATVTWTSAKEGELHAGGNPGIGVGTPPEFGGPHDKWSPEQLLTGAVTTCLMTTALYMLEKARVEFGSYTSSATGTMDKTREGLAFTDVHVKIDVTVAREDDVDKARESVLRAEKACPISRALRCPVRVDIHISHQTRE